MLDHLRSCTLGRVACITAVAMGVILREYFVDPLAKPGDTRFTGHSNVDITVYPNRKMPVVLFIGLMLFPITFYFIFLWSFGHSDLCPGPDPLPVIPAIYTGPPVPSITFHYTRRFYLEIDSEKPWFRLDIEEVLYGLTLLQEAGLRHLTLMGGEPFLYPKTMAYICEYAKDVLELETITIVTEGAKMQWRWLEKYGKYVDTIAISLDSFTRKPDPHPCKMEPGTGKPIDRAKRIFKLKEWCEELGIKFELHSALDDRNWEEDMVEKVKILKPLRWKVFQAPVIMGSKPNCGDAATEKARLFGVSDEKLHAFCERHKEISCLEPQPKHSSERTRLVLDEHMDFIDRRNGGEKHSRSIIEVGVARALTQVRWDYGGFRETYDSSRETTASSTSGSPMAI